MDNRNPSGRSGFSRLSLEELENMPDEPDNSEEQNIGTGITDTTELNHFFGNNVSDVVIFIPSASAPDRSPRINRMINRISIPEVIAEPVSGSGEPTMARPVLTNNRSSRNLTSFIEAANVSGIEEYTLPFDSSPKNYRDLINEISREITKGRSEFSRIQDLPISMRLPEERRRLNQFGERNNYLVARRESLKKQFKQKYPKFYDRNFK